MTSWASPSQHSRMWQAVGARDTGPLEADTGAARAPSSWGWNPAAQGRRGGQGGGFHNMSWQLCLQLNSQEPPDTQLHHRDPPLNSLISAKVKVLKKKKVKVLFVSPFWIFNIQLDGFSIAWESRKYQLWTQLGNSVWREILTWQRNPSKTPWALKMDLNWLFLICVYF